MQLGRIIPIVNSYSDTSRSRTNMYNLESSKGSFYAYKNIDNKLIHEFYVAYLFLIDDAILSDDFEQLSEEQEKLIRQFFKDGNTLTRETDENYEYVNPDDAFKQDIWEDVDNKYIFRPNTSYQALLDNLEDIVKDLDDFLGSYVGENNGRYSEYRKKQFHSKHKSSRTASSVFTRIK